MRMNWRGLGVRGTGFELAHPRLFEVGDPCAVDVVGGAVERAGRRGGEEPEEHVDALAVDEVARERKRHGRADLAVGGAERGQLHRAQHRVGVGALGDVESVALEQEPELVGVGERRPEEDGERAFEGLRGSLRSGHHPDLVVGRVDEGAFGDHLVRVGRVGEGIDETDLDLHAPRFRAEAREAPARARRNELATLFATDSPRVPRRKRMAAPSTAMVANSSSTARGRTGALTGTAAGGGVAAGVWGGTGVRSSSSVEPSVTRVPGVSTSGSTTRVPSTKVPFELPMSVSITSPSRSLSER